MPAITSYPYAELQFNKDGTQDAGNDLNGAATLFSTAGVTDLFVIAHGWNNDIDEARALYHGLFDGCVTQTIANTPLSTAKVGVVGILWPSKRFDDADLIPGDGGGALALDSSIDALSRKIDGLAQTFSANDADDKLTQAKVLLPQLETSPAAQIEFGELMLGIMRGAAVEPLTVQQDEDNVQTALGMRGDQLLAALASAPPSDGVVSGGGALGGVGHRMGDPVAPPTQSVGGAQGLGDIFHGILDGVRNALNLTTYYEMKNRAGIVGRGGAYQAVATLRAALPAVRIHLVGHSFGCRLVTSAADGPPNSWPILPQSITLLQGAYSHYAMAQQWDGKQDGLFRAVPGARVDGPIVLTFTKNDDAVGIAYALASRLAHQVAAGIGDASDPYGGLGRNGALKTPESDDSYTLGPVGTAYQFKPHKVYNLLADQYIHGHSDIQKNEVAYAMLLAAG